MFFDVTLITALPVAPCGQQKNDSHIFPAMAEFSSRECPAVTFSGALTHGFLHGLYARDGERNDPRRAFFPATLTPKGRGLGENNQAVNGTVGGGTSRPGESRIRRRYANGAYSFPSPHILHDCAPIRRRFQNKSLKKI